MILWIIIINADGANESGCKSDLNSYRQGIYYLANVGLEFHQVSVCQIE